MQQMGLTPGQPLVPGQVQAVAANPYLTGMPQVGSTYSPYFAPGPIMPTIMGPDPTGVGSPLGVVPQTVVAQQKMPRSDRLEVCREYQRGACKRAESECRFAHPADSVTANEDGTVTVCMDAVKGRCNRDPCRYFHPPLHLQAQIKAAQSRASAPAAVSPLLAPPQATAALEIGKKRPREPSTADTDLLLMDMKSVGSFYYDSFAFPAMMPYKRPAADKSGVPVYQPNATTYQQLMQLQQPFVPVSCAVPQNAPFVVYTDEQGQLLDTLPVCQDFNRGLCNRPACKFVHLLEGDGVEVVENRVAVCRDAAKGQCSRSTCKYYHIPVALPPAPVMAALASYLQ
ncbi:muscleblind-like protein 1 isoform X7 [Tribolium madens]|uniref:muscleblind-like protein 1 isoform X7 n=1 Tax=Tribolium madens TaxID=41895 RepID=UPI001CF750B1|nr:muscleblind-like protein 1 isoform X7 [Tribolium madens]